jgi:large subunit ribosomal protein L17
MRHRVRKGKLGLKTEHRLAVLRNLCTEFFRHGRITSTDARIKELRRFSEKIITTAKKDSVHTRRLINTKIKDKFIERPGGYTRIVKLHHRRGDSAPISLIELVGMQVPFKQKDEVESPDSSENKDTVSADKVE